MAGHFDFDGVSIERFYHFVSKTDEPTFDLLDELGLSDKLHWVPTTMGFFNEGRLYPWGDPLSLLRFPLIGIFDKLRYGLFALVCVRRDRWPALENETAEQWMDAHPSYWTLTQKYSAGELGYIKGGGAPKP